MAGVFKDWFIILDYGFQEIIKFVFLLMCLHFLRIIFIKY